MKKFKPTTYKGFLITVIKNNYDSFKYEYEIKAVSLRSKNLFIKKKIKVISSPTSYQSKEFALQHCKFNVDALFKIYYVL